MVTKSDKWRYFLSLLLGSGLSFYILQDTNIDMANKVIFGGIIFIALGKLFNWQAFISFGFGMTLCAIGYSIYFA